MASAGNHVLLCDNYTTVLQDLEQLMVVKARALRDPSCFVTAVKNGVSPMTSLS